MTRNDISMTFRDKSVSKYDIFPAS